jgi:hypothetical protein
MKRCTNLFADSVIQAELLRLAHEQIEFTADDLRARCGTGTRIPDKMMARRLPVWFKKFGSKRTRIIELTGGFRLSERNSGPLPLWRGTDRNRDGNRVDSSKAKRA